MDETQRQTEWRDWLQEHGGKFLLLARQLSRTEADAQDLVQEAIIEADKRHKDDSPPPLALVFATIQRRAIDLARRNGRRTSREFAAINAASEPWFDTCVEERERARLIQEAICKLPDSFRQVLTLKLWGGLTFGEIAALLNIPANTAASRYRYALLELRKLMKEVFV